MTVSFVYGGRFGNNLFQYIYGRLFSEYQGGALTTPWVHRNMIESIGNRAGAEYSGRPIKIDEGRDGYRPIMYHRQHHGRRPVVLTGYWQHARYYLAEESRILKYVRVPQPEPVASILGIAVRHEDYAQVGEGGSIIHPQWYADIINRTGFSQVEMIGNEIDQRWVKELRGMVSADIVDVSGDAKHDFRRLMTYENLIISNSSFAWWAAYLGRAMGSCRRVYSFRRWLNADRHIDLADTFEPSQGRFWCE